MSRSPQVGRQLKAFRLTDVPEPIRYDAMTRLLRSAGVNEMLVETMKLSDRIELGLAAARPSDKVYWVSQAAWDRVMRKRRRKR